MLSNEKAEKGNLEREMHFCEPLKTNCVECCRQFGMTPKYAGF
jgi:hypothetical protein